MVLNGIDCIEEYDSWLKGKRLGLITSPTGLTREFTPTIDILHKRYNLAAMFSPEHGVRGDQAAGALVDTYSDPSTGVPVYSLYRKDSKKLTPEMLEKVDAVVYDIQDVGARYYTFISTLLYAMMECAKAGKELIVLDRVNPLGGLEVEGNIIKPDYLSFVGAYPMPVRYGMTAGEFAKMAASTLKIDCDLKIVPCKDWKRSMLFPETGLHWIIPSLNMPTFETALLYPGTCLFEGTNLSEGRGTALPFSMIGAPFVQSQELADEMNRQKLAGVYFRPAYFTPTTSKCQGEKCGGVHLIVTDARDLKPVETGVKLLYTIRRLYEDAFQLREPQKEGGRSFMDMLCGDSLFNNSDLNVEETLARFRQESEDFKKAKEAFRLYA